jgi:hypothetical protein
MRVLILAAGRQERWRNSGGKGHKQFITVDGEPIIRRTFRLASERCKDVITIVNDPEHERWEGLNPHAPRHEPWMGEMGKFLDSRHLWPDRGDTAVLFADTYFTPEALDLILLSEITQPTVFGRADTPRRRLEAFAIRWRSGDRQEVVRIAKSCCKHGLNDQGGTWRWFHHRHTASGYSWQRVRKLSRKEKNGWVELPPDATDDFDELKNLRKWRNQWQIAA